MQFNTRQWNTDVWNGGPSIATVYSLDTLVFENFSLSDGSQMILTDAPISGPKRNIIDADSPRSDGSYIVGSYFDQSLIVAQGYAKASTAAGLDALLDTIRKSIRKQEGNLDYTDANGTVKRYVATCDNYDAIFADRKGYHVTICPWKIQFRSDTPFARARTYSSSFLSFATASNQTVYQSGTYKAQPCFLFVFSAATSVTTVNVSNSTTGEQIQYVGSIAAGDVLIFDSEQKTVTKNGTAVNFSGSFPSLDVGSNVLSFTVDGTYAVEETTKWKPTFI